MKICKLYICHTVYHLYISLLKSYDCNDIVDILLIDTISEAETIANRINAKNIINNAIYLDRKKVFKKRHREYLKNYINYSIRKNSIDKSLEFIKQYDDIYIYNDYSEMGCYLISNNIQYHLIEDGLDVFKQFDVYEDIGHGYWIKKALYQLFRIPYSVGMSKQCIDVEINDSKGLKSSIKHNIVVVPRYDLEAMISKEYREKMFDIFGAQFVEVPPKSALLLTQVLTEIMVVKNNIEQLEFYKKVVEEYSNRYTIFIKPHPRDQVDYTALVESYGVRLLNKKIPMEIYSSLIGNRFDIVITYSSTSANIMTGDTRIIRLDKRL